MTTKEKQCGGPCGAVKPIDSFSKRSSAPDGHHPHCKDCESAYWQQYNEKNPPGLRKSKRLSKAALQALHPGEKQCSECQDWKPEGTFYEDSRQKRGKRAC